VGTAGSDSEQEPTHDTGMINLQLAQLSQKDRVTAAWGKFGQNWTTIFCRHYRSIFNHCDRDVIGLQTGL